MLREDIKWKRLARLLEPFHPMALGTARRLARSADRGDDLYQETVLRAYAKLHTLRDEARFRYWFFAVMLSVHRAFYRRSFWRRFSSLEAMEQGGRELRGSDALPEEDFLSARRMQRALDRLSAAQRQAVVLFELEGFSIEEIAQMQRASISSVKSRLTRGRQKLCRHYEKMGWFAKREPRVLGARKIPQGG